MYHLILQATKPPRPHERETERQHFERMARDGAQVAAPHPFPPAQAGCVKQRGQTPLFHRHATTGSDPVVAWRPGHRVP